MEKLVKKLVRLAQVALQSLAHNKLRSLLTMLGVVIGVGAVIVMVSIGEGARRRVAQDIQGLGSNLLVVRPGFDRKGPVRAATVQTLTLDDARAIEGEVDGLALIAPESGQTAQVKYLGQNAQTTVLGVTAPYPQVNNYKLEGGRMFEGDDVRLRRKVAVLGATVSRELFDGAPAVGQTIKVKGVNFEVIGTLVAKGQSGFRDPDDQILVPITTAQSRLFGITYLRAISVQAQSEDAMDRAAADIGALLRKRHRLAGATADDFTVRNQKEILDTASQVAGTFTLLLGAVAAISLLVGGIGIMNIMLVSVTERTREIGIRKAVGARSGDVLFQFLVEAVVLSVLGGLVGIACGVGGAVLVTRFGWDTAVGAGSVGLAFGVAAATGIFFGLYPARKASRLDPIAALRFE